MATEIFNVDTKNYTTNIHRRPYANKNGNEFETLRCENSQVLFEKTVNNKKTNITIESLSDFFKIRNEKNSDETMKQI